jgi:hypothetical protein
LSPNILEIFPAIVEDAFSQMHALRTARMVTDARDVFRVVDVIKLTKAGIADVSSKLFGIQANINQAMAAPFLYHI